MTAEADLGHGGFVIECQRADERAHGEADAAEHGDTIELAEGRAGGAVDQSEPDGEKRDQEHARLLADGQAGNDTERNRTRQRRQRDARKRHACIGEGEQRDDGVADPGFERMLGVIEQAFAIVAGHWHGKPAGDAGDCN
jgi:hypothetical protein